MPNSSSIPFDIDPEFQALIPPLARDEYDLLVMSLEHEGCREPLSVWFIPGSQAYCEYCDRIQDILCGHGYMFGYRGDADGSEEEWFLSCEDCRRAFLFDADMDGIEQESIPCLLIDGHHRFEICERLNIKYDVTPYFFETRDEVLRWILQNQLGRRNLCDLDRVAIAIKLKPLLEAQAKERQGMRTDLFPNLGKGAEPVDTEEEIAKLAGVSHGTVYKATTILDHGTPALTGAVRNHQASIHTAATIATLPAIEQEELVARGKAEILATAKLIRAAQTNRTHFTGENEWYTPAEDLRYVRAVLGTIELDPASSALAQEQVGAARWFGIEDEALIQPWIAGTLWLNPPYTQPLISQFIDKLLRELLNGHVGQAILLTHNYTDTTWFQKACKQADAVCFPRGRIRFVAPTGEVAAPTQGQVFMYFGTDPTLFAEVFQVRGILLIPRKTFYGI